MSNFINYFLRSTPGPQMKYYIPLVILCLALIIGGIVFSQIYKRKKKTNIAFKKHFKSLAKILVILGFILGFLLVVRYENIPYFSMRLWLYTLFALILFFTYRYVKIAKVEYPKTKASQKKKVHSKTTKTYTASKKRKGHS